MIMKGQKVANLNFIPDLPPYFPGIEISVGGPWSNTSPKTKETYDGCAQECETY